MKTLLLILLLLAPISSFSQKNYSKKKHPHKTYVYKKHKSSHGGKYTMGKGGSHKGGKYFNTKTGKHYGKHKH